MQIDSSSQSNFDKVIPPFSIDPTANSVETLEYRIIHSNTFTGKHKELLNNTYKFWVESWEKTFKQLDVEKSGNSDDFLNKEIGCLYHGTKPIGLLMYHFLDLEMPCFLRSSYFNNYPDSLLNSISRYPGTTMVITYMTLDKAWRRRVTTYPISELLISFSVLRLIESPAQRLIGYFRNNRGTQNIFYRHGGVPLKKNARAYNVDIDFAMIQREKAQLSKRGACDVLALKKWNEFKLNHKGEPNVHTFNSERTNEATARSLDVGSLGKREFL